MAAHGIRSYGERHHISELTEPKFALEQVADHDIAMACRGVANASCYYRAPYNGGAAFVLLAGVPPSVAEAVTAERAATVLMQVISQWDVDHRPMTRHFLEQQGFDLLDDASSLTASRPGAARVVAAFDDLGRISQVQVETGSPASGTKPWWKRW